MRYVQKQMGKKPPELKEKPELNPHLQFYWDSYWRLHKSRGQGINGPASISLQDIQTYCEIQDIQSTERVCRMIDYLQAMDDKFMEIAQRQQGADVDGE